MLRNVGGHNVTSYHGLLVGTARRSIDTSLLQTVAFTRMDDTMTWVGY